MLALATMGHRHAKAVAPAFILAALPFVTPFTSRRFLNMSTNLSILCKQASSVRSKLPHRLQSPLPSDVATALSYPSAYLKQDDEGSRGAHMRGFCNWVVPDLLMVGQYPGQNPEATGPNPQEAAEHIRSVVADAGIRTFCCLQSEVPAQADEVAWEKAENDGGGVYLDGYARSMWPKPFTWYAPMVRRAMECDSISAHSESIRYLHVPIDDLTVPESSGTFYGLLGELLSIMDERGNNASSSREDGGIYIHCWGGRGRAGLVGSCLLSLLYPELNAKQVLDLIQAGYDSRAGAERMPAALSRSPQTEEQRDFVRRFVSNRIRCKG